MWLWIRIALLVLAALAALMMPDSTPPVDPWGAVFIVVATALGLVFVLGVQTKNPATAEQWKPPGWRSPLFSFRQPLFFFHFAGWIGIVGGLSAMGVAWAQDAGAGTALIFISMGIGVHLALVLFQRAFAKKMTDALQRNE